MDHHTGLEHHPKNPEQNAIDKAANYLVDELNVKPDIINIGYAGYTRSARQASLSSTSPLVGTYDNQWSDSLGSFESGRTEWSDLLRNYLDNNIDGINSFSMIPTKWLEPNFYIIKVQVFLCHCTFPTV